MKIKATLARIIPLDNTTQRLFHALIGAAIFTILGWGIPHIYYQHLDRTIYYEVKEPVFTDKKEYQAGDTVYLLYQRTARVTSEGHAVLKLNLILDGRKVPLTSSTRDLVVKEGTEMLQVPFELPENLRNGNYFIEAIVVIYSRDIEKTTQFRSEVFKVVN